MNPDADLILGRTADQMMMQLAPELGASYLQSAAGVLSLLMRFVAVEYERGADIRVQENTDMRALFGDLAPSLGDAGLKAKLEVAAATRDTSFAISALNVSNAELRRLLIALQAHVEDIGDIAAQRSIWVVLTALAGRRVLSLA